MDRRPFIAWGSAAAVLLVVVGVSGALGIMQLVNGGSHGHRVDRRRDRRGAESGSQGQRRGRRSRRTAQPSSAPVAAAAVTERLYVIFNGDGVRLQPGGAPQDVRPQGGRANDDDASTRTPRRLSVRCSGGDMATPSTSRTPRSSPDRSRIVKRTYQARSPTRFRAPISREYGQWPSLPPGVPRPVPADNPDGSPVFSLDGQDASGTPVYRRVGSDRQTGIAIAPGTTPEDPAAGNPNWTWWASPKP